MFLDGKNLQITQSDDKTNYLQRVFYTQPSSDAQSASNTQSDLGLPPKLHVPVHSFAAYQ